MKDYLKNNKNFILKYEIKKNTIIVNFVNGKKIKLEKNDKNINFVNSIMKKQLDGIDENKLEKDEEKTLSKILMWGIASVAGIASVIIFSFYGLIYVIISLIISILPCIFAFKNISKLSKIDNTMKNIEYIKNEEIINNEMKNSNLLNNVSKKIINIKKKDNEFNINNIDKLSYKELKELLKIIERIKYLFSFEETKEQSDKSKQLTMKKPN